MGLGLKPHSHAERARIIEALVPLIQRHVGKDLVALAATGSFARGTDGRYSDIEVIGIVSNPQGERAAVKFIHDGMLIDMWFLTSDHYLDHHRDKVTPDWPYASSSELVPILNAPLIEALSRAARNSSAEARLAALKRSWPDFQEWSAKVLNAAHNRDANALPYLYWQMAEKMCAILSLLNGRPFTTRASIFSEVHAFEILPGNFHALLTPHAASGDAEEVARNAMALFEGLERILLERGLDLYAPSLDAFVVEPAPVSPLRRVARKARRTLGATLRPARP